MRIALGIVVFAFAAGCAEEPVQVAAPKAEPLMEAPDVPTYCASKDKPCLPPRDFVERLCADRYTSVAPYLFQKHTPFVRLHAKSHSIESKNGFGGPVSSSPVAFAEEVLLLRVTSTPGGAPKRNADEVYDVLRWDGTCATIPKRDLVTYLPGMPQAAMVEFTKLDTTMRAALTRDPKISKLSTARADACKDGESSEACAHADKALSEAVVAAIRQGTRLPMPRERPPAGKSSAKPAADAAKGTPVPTEPSPGA